MAASGGGIKVDKRYAWRKFLHHQRWTDIEVLNRQPDDEVTFAWEVYQLDCTWGRLG
jgi:hypothetical protein